MATVPDELRNTIAACLAALVRGGDPARLVWVREYGAHGATLIVEHRRMLAND